MSKSNPSNKDIFNDFIIEEISNLGIGINLAELNKIQRISNKKSAEAIVKSMKSFDKNDIDKSDMIITSKSIIEKREELNILIDE